MGKKKLRSKYTSKSQRKSMDRWAVKAVARDVPEVQKALNKLDAWRKGKNPWITVLNNSGETNKKYVRVKANILYGNPKFATYDIYKTKKEM